MKALRILLAPAALAALALLPLRAEEPPAAPALTPASLAAALAGDLKSHYNLEGDLDIQFSRPWTPPAAAATVDADWSVLVLDYPATPSSSMLVRCRIRCGHDTQEAQLVLRAALWRDAWVVRLPLTVGTVFDPSRLEVRRSDMLRDHDLVPASEGDRAYVFSRPVPVGRMLTWHDVARHPLVHKGDMVEVFAVDGMLLVRMKAVAMSSGAQGETVTVRNPDSRKEFTALVTDENRVKVQF